MSIRSWKDNISFVLVEPSEPGNIGSAARALKNMGFSGLEVVGGGDFVNNESAHMACNAVDVLKKMKVYPSFTDAIREKSLVVGTTRRTGRKRGLILPLRDSVERIVSVAKRNKVGILFGRERNGLTNLEVEQCGFLLTIPAEASSPSLNLAQSVMLVAYEIAQNEFTAESPRFVDQKKRTVLYEHLKSTLKLLEYIPRGNRDIETKIMKNLKGLIGRTGLTEWEFRMLRGICVQIEKKVKK